MSDVITFSLTCPSGKACELSIPSITIVNYTFIPRLDGHILQAWERDLLCTAGR